MKLPYGLSNFKAVITQGYAYVDKTAYIEQLENDGKYHFLLRPRRFGKSLFISTLEYYYDVQYREDFSQIFGELYIGKHPTSLRNTYQVLFLEFSGIDTNRGEEHIYQRFNDKVEVNLQSFLQRYAYPPQTIAAISTRHSPEAKLEYFFQITNGQQVLLLIDEYDHFANAILASDLSLFKRIMGKGGFVRSFYETIKTATQRGTLDRMFITGVTPLMLDSLTSGFNISENLSLSKHFNAALGFTRQEVTQLLQTLGENKLSDSLFEQLLRDITRWYNGYRFHPQAAETVYNPDMVLYFLKQFDWATTSYPDRMLDDNIASDYQKIMALFSIGNRDSNYQVLDELITNGTIVAQQQRKFELEKNFGRDDFISLLAYMGFISITGKTISQTLFGIPNHVIQELYYQYFKVEIERRNQLHIANHSLSLAIETFALQDDIQPLVSEMKNILKGLSNRDAQGMDEKHIKTLLLTLLYQVPIYFIQSEREINRRYPDILLLERSPFAVNHQHLIELKYSKKNEGVKGMAIKRQEGITQVQGYLQLPDITNLAKLSAWLLVTDGEQIEVVKIA